MSCLRVVLVNSNWDSLDHLYEIVNVPFLVKMATSNLLHIIGVELFFNLFSTYKNVLIIELNKNWNAFWLTKFVAHLIVNKSFFNSFLQVHLNKKINMMVRLTNQICILAYMYIITCKSVSDFNVFNGDSETILYKVYEVYISKYLCI